MRVSSYAFGKIVVDGETHTSDVIIHPDRVDGSWWRKEGHLLQLEDLGKVLDSGADTLVVGTGYYGRMVVPEEVLEFVKSRGIKPIIAPTEEAVNLFNELGSDPKRRVVAAFHLTC